MKESTSKEYIAGENAFEMGFTLNDNPYIYNLDKAKFLQWYYGYCDAETNAGKRLFQDVNG